RARGGCAQELAVGRRRRAGERGGDHRARLSCAARHFRGTDCAMIPLSVLDLVPIREGATISQALADTADLARAAEESGYKRFWTAEHHGADGLAGAAVSVVLAHIGHATSTIRIGAGGIMLPNHNPLVIAEQFGTLDALFP